MSTTQQKWRKRRNYNSVETRSNYELRSHRSNSTICSQIEPITTTFKLFQCPMPACRTTLSPSTLLSHITVDHRSVKARDLRLHTKLTFDVNTFELLDSENPRPLCFVKIHGDKEIYPLLLNTCCFSDNGNTSWICLWLSGAGEFPNWFSIRISNDANRKTSLTIVCKPVMIQSEINVLGDPNVMVVERSTVDSITKPGGNILKIQIQMYEA